MAALAFQNSYVGPQASVLAGTVNALDVSFAWELTVIPDRIARQFSTAFGGSFPGRDLLSAPDYDLCHLGLANVNGFASPNPIFREDEFIYRALERPSGTILLRRADNSDGIKCYVYVPTGYEMTVRALVL